MLDASEPLFLHRGHEGAVDEESGGGVAVIRVDPEDVHTRSRSLRVEARRGYLPDR
jgi:hypothetical protein